MLADIYGSTQEDADFQAIVYHTMVHREIVPEEVIKAAFEKRQIFATLIKGALEEAALAGLIGAAPIEIAAELLVSRVSSTYTAELDFFRALLPRLTLWDVARQFLRLVVTPEGDKRLDALARG